MSVHWFVGLLFRGAQPALLCTVHVVCHRVPVQSALCACGVSSCTSTECILHMSWWDYTDRKAATVTPGQCRTGPASNSSL